MKKREILFLFLILVSFQFVNAAVTTINIDTFSNHDVMVSALKPGYVYNLIESFRGVSGTLGKFSATLNTENIDKIDLKVWVKKNNEIIVMKKFESYNVGETINLEVFPDNYTKPVPIPNTTSPENVTNNVSVNENKTITETEIVNDTPPAESGGAKLTGSTIKEGAFSGKTVYYIIAGVILLAAILFFGVRGLKRKSTTSSEVKVRKLSELQKERTEMRGKSAEDYKRAFETAQKKLEDSQKEINQLKNQDKIKQIETRIHQEQDEIRRLRRGF